MDVQPRRIVRLRAAACLATFTSGSTSPASSSDRPRRITMKRLVPVRRRPRVGCCRLLEARPTSPTTPDEPDIHGDAVARERSSADHRRRSRGSGDATVTFDGHQRCRRQRHRRRTGDVRREPDRISGRARRSTSRTFTRAPPASTAACWSSTDARRRRGRAGAAEPGRSPASNLASTPATRAARS